MARQGVNKEILHAFEGKQVKVVFQDIDHPQILRGLLIQVGEDMLLIKGDYTQQAIPITSVLKISTNMQGGQE
jgi:hypothetical protein